MEEIRRPRGLSRRLRFEPDPEFEWALWCRQNDPRRWAQISDRAKVSVGYYELARAAWMAGDEPPARAAEGGKV